MIRYLVNFYIARGRRRWVDYTLKNFGQCGENVRIRYRSSFIHPEYIEIGNNVHIGENAWWRGDGGIIIGDNTIISRNSVIFSAVHNYHGEMLPYDNTYIYGKVVLGNHVWIGMNVMIKHGITIGDGAIVAMGTVVTEDVPPMAIVGGRGSRIIKYRDEEEYLDNLRNNRFLHW